MEIEKLCPVCKVNYLNEDEEICFLCQKARDAKAAEAKKEDDWMYSEENDDDIDEEMEISLDLVAEEEEDAESEAEESTYKDPDDFD